MLTLYDYYRSSACFRVRIALNLKNLDYQTASVHLVNNGGEQHLDNYQILNPHKLVPTLQDTDKIMTQSLAIIEYLDDCFPEPPLLPQSPYEKCLARAFALSIAADIHPLNNLRVLNYLTKQLHVSNDDKKAWYQHWVELGLNGLEKQLVSHQSAGQFCFGDTPTIADICLAPQLYNARRFNCDLSHCPTLVRIDANCQTHPAFEKAWPVEVTA